MIPSVPASGTPRPHKPTVTIIPTAIMENICDISHRRRSLAALSRARIEDGTIAFRDKSTNSREIDLRFGSQIESQKKNQPKTADKACGGENKASDSTQRGVQYFRMSGYSQTIERVATAPIDSRSDVPKTYEPPEEDRVCRSASCSMMRGPLIQSVKNMTAKPAASSRANANPRRIFNFVVTQSTTADSRTAKTTAARSSITITRPTQATNSQYDDANCQQNEANRWSDGDTVRRGRSGLVHGS